MAIDKRQVLFDAPQVLNRPDVPWAVWVEGDSIKLRWKWEAPQFFGPPDLTDSVKQFIFTFALSDKGTWKEIDQMQEASKGVSIGSGGIGFGSSSSTFKGKTSQKSFELGLGRKEDGRLGLVSAKYDTEVAKKFVRDWLTSLGWKKAGLFG